MALNNGPPARGMRPSAQPAWLDVRNSPGAGMAGGCRRSELAAGAGSEALERYASCPPLRSVAVAGTVWHLRFMDWSREGKVDSGCGWSDYDRTRAEYGLLGSRIRILGKPQRKP